LRFHRAIRVFALLLTPAGSGLAQTSGLDLRTTLEAAQATNLELRAARQNRAVALAGITMAGAIPNPTLSFSGTRDVPHESIVFDLPLEIGGKRAKRLAVSREEQAGTELEIQLLERNVRRRTREAFFKSMAAHQQTVQTKAAFDISSRIKEIVQQRFDAGDVPQLDVIQADVELARSQADYEMSLQTEKSADVQLAALLNRKLDAPLQLQGRLEEVPASPTMESIIDTALHSNPDVQKFTQQYKLELRRLDLAKSMRIPNLGVQGGVDLNSPPDFNVGGRGQIAVSLPLFYRGQGEVAQSNARLELLRLTLQSEQTMVSAQVAAAYFDLTAKIGQADRYSKNILPQTTKLEQMAEDSYTSGKSNLLTLIDAQRKLNDVRKAYIDSLFAAQSSFAALEEVVGAPLD
jgi:cobalt-zinc-cadmium efflux system outer membrane protein